MELLGKGDLNLMCGNLKDIPRGIQSHFFVFNSFPDCFLHFRSNDVTLANKMESTGKPGMVHISERTYSFLKNEYFVQEGSPVGSNLLCSILAV